MPWLGKADRQAPAHGRRYARGRGIDALMRKHRAVAIVVPTGGPAGLIDKATRHRLPPTCRATVVEARRRSAIGRGARP